MPLSRLENFLKNVQGNVIYVNPEELDATDDIGNTGNSRARPFKTIQRALIESARFSYQIGKDNDKFDKTTILVSPGTHYIDNRPGYSINTDGDLFDVNGTSVQIDQFSVGTNFNIHDPNNELYKFNSIHGGVIMPRGTSVVGQDLRKTKIRPKYIPDPHNNNLPRTSIFKVTGSCWFFGFSFFDGDQQDRTFRDYTKSVYTPNYSHHKLTCFEFADGVNNVGDGNLATTDLDMYYNKLTLGYGTNSGRALPNYPANNDFETQIDETRIVGAISQLGAISIKDIYSGRNTSDTTATPVVTDITKSDHRLNVDTPILITGVDNPEYDGSYMVTGIVNDTTFTYALATTPTSTATPLLVNKEPFVTIESDTVTSSSPYIFNCSIRSVFGMNGMDCDGDKATGFKSMVTAQFTGISLNKDDNAYVLYNEETGIWEDQATLGSSVSLHTNSRARHKPDWENFHVRVASNSIIQAVSVFAIGYAKHFVADKGGDMSITNSNSNFGARALEADKYRFEAFGKDDAGYITEIIPPQKNTRGSTRYNWVPVDVDNTDNLFTGTGLPTGIGSTDTKLLLHGYTQKDALPPFVTNGYNIGNKENEIVYANIENAIYASPILMPVPQSNPDERVVAKKESEVLRENGINKITGSRFTLRKDHKFLQGESVRIYSEDGSLPDGIEYGRMYYVIPVEGAPDEIDIATTYNNALAGTEGRLLGINNLGGSLRIVSTVEDKEPGQPGHPIQYDEDLGFWYVNVGAGNTISTGINTNTATISPKTQSLFIYRKPDQRSAEDKTYRVRYVIPESATLAAAPNNGFSIEESSAVIDDDMYGSVNDTLTSVNNLRTSTNIVDATWAGNVAIVTAQNPHRLNVGNIVEVTRLKSENNANGLDNLGFNGIYSVLAITDSKTFSVGLNTNPGSISTISNAGIPYTVHDATVIGSGRTDSPYFVKRTFGPSYQIYANTPVQEYKKDVQDGVYDLSFLSYHSTPEVAPFNTDEHSFAQDYRNVVPKVSIDNPEDDPIAAKTYAVRDDIGDVNTSDPARSLTKESLDSMIESMGIGIGITSAEVNGNILTVHTATEHGLNGVKAFTITSAGTNYGTQSGGIEKFYSARLVGGAGKGATADVTVNTAGAIASLTISDPGSSYNVGDLLTVSGVPKHSLSGGDCTITVSTIKNNTGDAIEVVGVSSTNYNGLFRIQSVPSSRSINYVGDGLDAVPFGQGTGYVYHVGVSTGVNTISHDPASGISTITVAGDNGWRIGDTIKIEGYQEFASVYNGVHYVTDKIDSTTYKVNIGITSNAPAAPVGVATAYGTGFSVRSSNRGVPIYGGHTTNLASGIGTADATATLDDSAGLKRGDYLLIEDEIVRVSNESNGLLRGLLGTNAVEHADNAPVRRIKVLPVEGRRYSILRASGHTFEYVGFGPGNYSTAMPQTQDRVLATKEQLLSQSRQTRGGFVIYTGMNDSGDFYIGKLKFEASGGTLTEVDNIGDGEGGKGFKLPNSAQFDDLTVIDNFYSLGNTEIIDLTLTGNRAGTINKSVHFGIWDSGTGIYPNNNTDNVLFQTEFKRGGYIGWVKTKTSGAEQWQVWGPISRDADSEHYSFDQLALGRNKANSNKVLHTEGDVKFESDIEQIGDYERTGDLTNTGNVTITGTLNGQGAVDFDDTLNVDGNVTFNGNTTIGNSSSDTLTVTATSTFNGAAEFNNGITTNEITVENLTSGRVALVGSGGKLVDSSAFTYSGSNLIVTGDITAFATSDERLKDHVHPIEDPLDKILKISGNTFEWNDKSGKTGRDVGVLAQEIEEVIPEVVTTRDTGYKAVRYEKLVPLLIEAVKELTLELNELKAVSYTHLTLPTNREV